MKHYVLLLIGVLACSTAVIMIKASTVHPVMLSASRLLLASLLLLPLFVRAWRSDRRPLGLLARRSLLGAALLAAHFISWAAGARMTAAANGSLIVNLVPVVMPFMLFVVFREVLTRREVIGSVVSLAGVALLTVGDYKLGGSTIAGDLTCFFSMVLVTGYLVVSRVRNDGTSLWLYLVPLYLQAGLMCLLLATVWPGPAQVISSFANWQWELLLLVGLAVVPTIIGHSLLNAAMRNVRGQIVSIFNLAQFLFAGLMAYLLFGESPKPLLYWAGALVVLGAIIILTERRTRPQPALAEVGED